MNSETTVGLVLPVDIIRDRLNRDPEFLLAARFWYCDIRFFIGQDPYFMRIENGKVKEGTAYLDTELISKLWR